MGHRQVPVNVHAFVDQCFPRPTPAFREIAAALTAPRDRDHERGPLDSRFGGPRAVIFLGEVLVGIGPCPHRDGHILSLRSSR